MNRRVAFTLALALVFTGVVGTHAEAATRLPDLIVSAVSAPSTAQPGQSFVLSASIKNQGKASANTVQVAFYLTKSASSITGATLLGTQNVGSLSAGAILALTTSLSTPSSTSPGTFYVVANADSAKVVKESNEKNNTRASGAIAVKDLTPPTISSVTSSGTTVSSATVTWNTDKSSSSQVEYGTTAAYGIATALDSSLVTSHAVTLSGLTAGKAYHFRVQSKDAAGNAALSIDYTFTTATATATATTATAGNTYYVATTGSDANPGTETQPFRTIAHGVSGLTPGDTLYVLSGTYAEALIHSIPPGTSWDSPVTVAAAPGHTVTIKPNSGANFVLHFQGPQQYIVIDRLILDATNVTYDAVKITGGVDPLGPAHHIQLIRCEVKNAPRQGILVTDFAGWNEFIDLDVHDNGTTWYDHGLYISTSHNLVEESIVYHNRGFGIHVYVEEVGQTANNNIVRSNHVYNNSYLDPDYGGGILLGSGDGNTAHNNLVHNSSRGIRVAYLGAPNTTIYNNTVYGNAQSGLSLRSDVSGAVFKNNIVYSNGSTNVEDLGTGTIFNHNLIGTNPLFANAAAGDFRLQSGSPAIDAGISVNSVTTDIAGTLRPQGIAYDIGAYEVIP